MAAIARWREDGVDWDRIYWHLFRHVQHHHYRLLYREEEDLWAHRTPAVQAWVAARRDRLEVFYLLRYAPELNPDAYLNNDLKGQAHTAGLPQDKAEVRSHIQGFMRRLLHLPERVMSYFQHPSVQYAAAMY
jgi:hypothetical protein